LNFQLYSNSNVSFHLKNYHQSKESNLPQKDKNIKDDEHEDEITHSNEKIKSDEHDELDLNSSSSYLLDENEMDENVFFFMLF